MHNGEYTLIFDSEAQMESVSDTSVNHAIVEKIFLDQGFVCQYQFDRKNGRWMLDRMNKQTMSHNPNASFLSFYRRFATDSVFRQQSLAQEIAFSGPDPDNDFEQMEGVITPDFWDAFAPELPHGTIYNIVYGHPHTHSNVKIFLLRALAFIDIDFLQFSNKICVGFIPNSAILVKLSLSLSVLDSLISSLITSG